MASTASPQPRLKDAGLDSFGISGGQWVTRERQDGVLAAGDPHEQFWDAVITLRTIVGQPTPGGYTAEQQRGYDDATALTNVDARVKWEYITASLERDWATASDEGAPWRDPETYNDVEQEKLDLYWDARADRSLELMQAFRLAEPHWIDGEALATPDGCRHCGYAIGSHGSRFIRGIAGEHRYIAPDDAIRKTRMAARRELASR